VAGAAGGAGGDGAAGRGSGGRIRGAGGRGGQIRAASPASMTRRPAGTTRWSRCSPARSEGGE
jgi:hypothetical protein